MFNFLKKNKHILKEQIIETPNKEKKENKNFLYCPAIYLHFKNKYYATMDISVPKNRKFLTEISSDCEIFKANYTEQDGHFIFIYKYNNKYFHNSKYEKLVLYKSLYDDTGIYARPYDIFMSKVDKEKYPDSKQEYRFELKSEFIDNLNVKTLENSILTIEDMQDKFNK